MFCAAAPCCAWAMDVASRSAAAAAPHRMNIEPPPQGSRRTAIVPEPGRPTAWRLRVALDLSLWRTEMMRTLMAAALAAVLALPAAASAGSDSIVVAQGGGADGPATAAPPRRG